ncbi:glycosyltransferase family 2 protein [Paenibacillus sp. FA6]|uniref:glycosyltransferase family 2 protein n=1 Tax=Paenibacillus sp. FA6 TaxID=3413029 RepID=UPI003F65BEFF
MSPPKKRILIGSPIHQKPAILLEFLSSLLHLKQHQVELYYYFIDDNIDQKSSDILQQFSQQSELVLLQSSGYSDEYVRDNTTHLWNSSLIWKVANFKNMMIQHAAQLQYDYLFLIDSDLILHPDTIEHLVAADKDIISEIFWTQWQPNKMFQPQVWMRDEYDQWEQQLGEQLSAQEIAIRFEQFITKLKNPGIYEVGGLGACTLISQHAIQSGVNFNPIRNISFWGEDRHFCIRAAALDIPLYVDTHYPALHLYRDSELDKVASFKKESGILPIDEILSPAEIQDTPHVEVIHENHKLTLTMVVKNESSRFLRQVLEEHRKYIDEAVIIDDGSSDTTIDLCREVLEGIPVRIIHNIVSKFSNEIDLRKQQWEEVLKSNPDWILNLNADEMFEPRFAQDIRPMLRNTEVDLICFRLYDFWNKDHYREDLYWQAHFHYRPFLIRYKPDFVFQWKETAQHCGRFPENIFALPYFLSGLRLKHLGWSRPEYRLEKYLRYNALDPNAEFGWKEQYASILDEHPNLVPWVE